MKTPVVKNIKQPQRNEVVECGRLLAATCIVWLHTVGAIGFLPLESSTRWNRWAVPFFIAASLWFANPASESKSPLEYFKIRCLRLYPVFLIWNLFYLGIRLLSGTFLHSSLKVDAVSFLKQLFFDGFAHHLWFLTFLLLVEIGVTILAIVRPSIWFTFPAAALSLYILSIMPSSTYPTFGSYLMVMSWWSLPAVFLIVLCKPVIRYILVRNRYYLSYAAVFFIIGILTTWASTFGARNSAMEGTSGVFLFFGFLLLGLSNKISLTSALRSLVILSAGIYLIHVFYVEAFHHIAVAIGLPLHSYVGVISIFSLSMLASIISVAVLKKTGPSLVFNGVSLGVEKRN